MGHTRNRRDNQRDIRHYFEYSSRGIEVIRDGLQEMSFGEFLVDLGAIDRFQLFRALQLQDHNPGVRLGECVAALGYILYTEIEQLLREWKDIDTVILRATIERQAPPPLVGAVAAAG
jgi:hypothetical protein